MAWDVIRRWRKSRPLTLFALCLTIGLIIGHRNAVPWWLWAAALAGSATAGIIRRRSIFIFSGAMLLGALMVSLALIRPAVSEADNIQLTGTLSDEVRVYEEYIRFPLRNACADGKELPSRVMVYLYGPEYPELEYGSSVSVKANLYLPSGKDNPLGFDYSAYLWREGVALCASASAKNLTITAPPGFSLKGLTLQCRAAMQSVVERIYPVETVPLISALLLGDRSMLPDDLVDQFNTAGVAHLLAVSGLHITSLAFFLDFILRKTRCPSKVSFAVTTLLLIVYTWIVGYPPSIVRAVLMYTLSTSARLFGRPSDGLTGLSLALIILLIINPLMISDASLILSFASVGGLLTLTRLLRIRRLPKKPAWLNSALYWVLSAFAASLAAQLGALPAVANIYGMLPTYSLLSNLPVLPLITLALPVAMLSLLLGAFFPFAGQLLARVVSFGLDGLISFTGWISTLPASVISTPDWPVALILMYISLCALSTSVTGVRRWIKYICLALLPVLAGSALLLPMTLPTTDMEVLFLDAGQADAAVLRAEDQYYLVDVGENSVMADYLSSTGIRPKAVFLSHPHADHSGGLADVIELCPPATIYIPCLWDSVEADEGVPEVLQAAREAGWTVQPLQAADGMSLSDNVYAAVHQPWPGMTQDGNGASLVLHVQLHDGSVLFTGDLPMEDELAFFPDCDVLKVAHHGAASSTSSLFLQMTTPSVAVISVGHNSYGHPSGQTLSRLSGIPIYRTDECGAVSVLIRPDGSTKVTPMRMPIESEAVP